MTSRFSRSAATISAIASVFSRALRRAEHTHRPTRSCTNPRAGADDPRVGLKAGLYDAGEAAFGMQRLASLPKPPGFAPDLASIAASELRQLLLRRPPERPPPRGPQTRPRANYGSTNSDLAFSGNHLFVGNYNGINFYDIDNPAKIKLRTSLICPGGQGDVSVYGHLLFMSAEAVNGRIDCGTQGIPLPAGYAAPASSARRRSRGSRAGPRRARPPPPPSPDRFRGVRIFDISDLSNPKQVAAVQSCRGSHTHTLVIDPKDKDNVYIYISGTGGVRQAEELAGCSGGDPSQNPNTALIHASTSSRCRWRIRSRRRSSPARASLPMRRPEP